MKFTETHLAGAFVIEPELLPDERGFFARSFCRQEFEQRGLVGEFVQSSISFNALRGTLRGLHFQSPPFPEVKLVRCTSGVVFDVVVDIRTSSPTLGQWFGTELSAVNRRILYVPVGFAHGFITLQDGSEVFYQMSEYYHPECARSLLWRDVDISIDWPLRPVSMSIRDAQAPVLRELHRF